jgi:hypothetical protein
MYHRRGDRFLWIGGTGAISTATLGCDSSHCVADTKPLLPVVVSHCDERCRRCNDQDRSAFLTPMKNEHVIAKMRQRVEQCRRLAAYTTDEHTRRVLNQMAGEAEADLRQLQADSGEQDNERREG